MARAWDGVAFSVRSLACLNREKCVKRCLKWYTKIENDKHKVGGLLNEHKMKRSEHAVIEYSRSTITGYKTDINGTKKSMGRKTGCVSSVKDEGNVKQIKAMDRLLTR